ncbi:hypothetical protein [Mycolicibacterium komossense]|uniref:Uncharacterized protein n=1 Tax=Mycolicibacterium komossense TaxID=1779 RepID=A0ABT3CKE1_9MYCO|nr:hypothetical protein [Mycolicibacterium komossense]MCV7229915.1 hypothetical protein [Mycolicibacterium komossense]
MGGGFAYLAARQHADLTGILPSSTAGEDRGAGSLLGAFVLVLLAIDGILCAVASALFLPLYIGRLPFPISAVIAGLVNAALVWAAMYWTPSNRFAALPLWTWLLTVGALTFAGPGGDIVFSDIGLMLLLLVLGSGPAGWLLWRRNQSNQLPPAGRQLVNRKQTG